MSPRRPAWLPQEWVDNVTRFATRLDLYSFGRWLALASAVGVVAGLGAAVLTWGVEGVGSILHGQVVGFEAPGHGPAGSTH